MDHGRTLEPIEEAVQRYPGGAALSDIRRHLPEVNHRTLQDRIRRLVRAGRLVQRGERKGTRYFVGSSVSVGPSGVMSAAIPLSQSGNAIRSLVSLPLSSRRPVGYQRAFLDRYRPNRTHYLSRAQRSHLHARGRGDSPPTPAGTYMRDILSRLLIDLSWNSSRLEGNTYSLLDTQRLVELGQAAEGKDAREATMILNHKAAIEFLVENVQETGLNPITIRNLHALLSADLLADPTAPGRLRRMPIGIAGSVFQPLSAPQLIEECFHTLLSKAQAIEDPFEQAFFVMVHLPYLQPFDDVNKRVSRLAANIPLIHRELAPISFTEVPGDEYLQGILGVYERQKIELLRDVFIWAYERSAAKYAAQRQSMGEPDPFRVRYRKSLQSVVGEIIREGLAHSKASTHIERWSRKNVPPTDIRRFTEMAEAELLGISEGNFARYGVRPSEYLAWRQSGLRRNAKHPR